MAGIIISPCTENKIKSRNAALRLRGGLPAFKDVLRQRFQRRIKDSRGRFMDKLREVDTSDGLRLALKQELSNIVSNLDNDSDLQMDIEVGAMEDDYLTDEEACILHHYNQLLTDDDLLQLYEESLQVSCPLCLKGYLQMNASSALIHCSSCILSLPSRASLQDISDHLKHCLESHEGSGCDKQISFFVSEEESCVYLYAACSSCSFLDVII